MNLLEIIILGIVEGLTEYLPVSSTGHLLLTESLLNMSQSKEALDALAVCIQGGAILAVLSLYYPRVKTMVEGVRGTNPAGLTISCAAAPAVRATRAPPASTCRWKTI